VWLGGVVKWIGEDRGSLIGVASPAGLLAAGLWETIARTDETTLNVIAASVFLFLAFDSLSFLFFFFFLFWRVLVQHGMGPPLPTESWHRSRFTASFEITQVGSVISVWSGE
jgi:hypothetical protein